MDDSNLTNLPEPDIQDVAPEVPVPPAKTNNTEDNIKNLKSIINNQKSELTSLREEIQTLKTSKPNPDEKIEIAELTQRLKDLEEKNLQSHAKLLKEKQANVLTKTALESEIDTQFIEDGILEHLLMKEGVAFDEETGTFTDIEETIQKFKETKPYLFTKSRGSTPRAIGTSITSDSGRKDYNSMVKGDDVSALVANYDEVKKSIQKS